MAITFDGQNDRVTTSSQALNLPTNVAGSLSVGGLNVGVGGTIVVGTGGTTLSLTNSGNLTVAGQIVCSAVSRNLNATGGNTITRFGEKRLHIFTSPGTFQVLSGSSNVEVMVVGGGGGGADRYGGGGAGGVAIGYIPVTPSPGAYAIIIGGGGAAGPYPGNNGSNGQPSTFSNPNITTITAVGGGGGTTVDNPQVGLPGGSGGGFGGNGNGFGLCAGGSATQPAQNPGNPLVTNYGNPGGAGRSQPGANSGGGGGGAGSRGISGWPGTNNWAAGDGGDGIFFYGSYYGGGGAGSNQSVTHAKGGLGGGGTTWVANPTVPAPFQTSNGLANTGGGGASGGDNPAGNGGPGVVVIAYTL